MGLFNIVVFNTFQEQLADALEFYVLRVITGPGPPRSRDLENLKLVVDCLQCCPRVPLPLAHGLLIEHQSLVRGDVGLRSTRWLWFFTSALKDVNSYMSERLRECTALLHIASDVASTPDLMQELAGLASGNYRIDVDSPEQFESAEACLYILSEIQTVLDELEEQDEVYLRDELNILTALLHSAVQRISKIQDCSNVRKQCL